MAAEVAWHLTYWDKQAVTNVDDAGRPGLEL